MRLRFVRFLLWAEYKIQELKEKYDVCHNCGEQADYWCESCGRRHCGECESGFYGDVEFCTVCFGEMTPDEIEQEIKESEETA